MSPFSLIPRGIAAALPGVALAALVLFGLPAPATAQAPVIEVEINTRPIERFRIGSDETLFGPLEFVGGFEMRSNLRRFGQLSSMRFLTPGEDFIGVADHGYWFFGTVERDADGIPTGIADFSMQQILNSDGTPTDDKHYADAEGLSVHDGVATVAFERAHRVQEFLIEPGAMAVPVRDLDFIVPRHELRYNQGIETVARAGPDSHLQGARIVIAERSIDPDGNLFAAILEGPERGLFFVRRSAQFDVTDGVFLPDGDLLLLERRFSLARGVAMRIRRIDKNAIRAGALVDGPVLMEADMTHQIDNMEAIDVWRRDDGALILSLMSDDNQSILQRSLYLEFVLLVE